MFVGVGTRGSTIEVDYYIVVISCSSEINLLSERARAESPPTTFGA